jgi:hypothetical protein
LADGRVITANVVVIDKVSVGGRVAASNVHAAVSGYGTESLLGKNFLDFFGSYEINNRSGQLCFGGSCPDCPRGRRAHRGTAMSGPKKCYGRP